MKTMTKVLWVGFFTLSTSLVLVSCKKRPAPEAISVQQNEVQKDMSGEDQHIQVQHILIGFKGSVPGKSIDRSPEEAEKLAKEILGKAKAGDNYDALVKQYTDDSEPGIYGMSNKGVAPGPNEFPRDNMVPAFGDVGFALKAGEYGLANFDKAKSPFGFHIIKRLK